MKAANFRTGSYEWRGQHEGILLRGPESGPQVLILPPLFEELNLTRAMLADVTRALAALDVGSWLPDLPGTGESTRSLVALGWDDWRDAARALGSVIAERSGAAPFTCAFRGGSLLDDAVAAAGRWRYAPVAGEALLHQMRRVRLLAAQEAGLPARPEEADAVDLAGYSLTRAMRDGLAAATPAAIADRELAGSGMGLWRRAEPSRDRELSERLAADICQWLQACGSR